MKAILLSNNNIADNYAFAILKHIIKPNMKVLCFNYASDLAWLCTNQDSIVYGQERNNLYKPFREFGIQEGNFIVAPFPSTQQSISYIKEKIRISDIIFFNGGKMENISLILQYADLLDYLVENKKDKVFIGASAGALILQDEYHITPFVDDDYKYYGIKKGFGIVSGVYTMPHFHNNRVKHKINMALCKMATMGKSCYALGENGGVIIDEKKRHICIGEVYKVN